MNNEASSTAELPQIAGYKLLRAIGDGGMSTVYLAEQISLGRQVAIKVMLPEALADEVSRRRFENEARTIARLEHPHIVGIHEVGRTADGLPYYAMPYLARGHVGQRDFTQDQPRVLATLRALLSALDYAHAREVVHRDVKAENVLFDEAERPLLADFGIALRKSGDPRVTAAGMAVGSTAYMAPEQARGDKVDRRVDLYSVGVLAYEMLMGKLPYSAKDALSMAMQHLQDPIPRLPREKRHWQRFIDKAMAKSPSMRFRNAHQAQEALNDVERRSNARGFAIASQMHHRITQVRQWPVGIWIATGLVAAALIGIALRQPGEVAGERDFFSIGAPSELPVPEAISGQAVVGTDTIDGMLRDLPESAAEPLLAAARQQIGARNLISPKGANAYDSIVAAYRADPGHAGLDVVADALVDAFSTQMRQQLKSRNDSKARDYLTRATQLFKDISRAESRAVARMRASALESISARVDEAEKDFDRDGAVRAAELATQFGAPGATSLMARARRIAQPGESVPGDRAGMVLVRSNSGLLAAGRSEVTRGDYARFSAATGRPASLCRERASLLRIVKPINWREPGFAQADSQPVVCVSWADADAYARWMSQQSGHRYRIPKSPESGALPGGGSARSVAEWLQDCGGNCRQRMTTGASWRGTNGSRPLPSDRGYDDVGFRLVREL
ncbi:MAG: bifunctional serine/threonine-protein kinase/formylglycine-generating enzyme family protein [Pseudomonadota bacterium]|nr:bifunctional serine/threonine-protein kinase/formylglycine-generating enzyme family protein [Pseudomonadota bacterium]